MKREDLLRHLRRHGCQPLRERVNDYTERLRQAMIAELAKPIAIESDRRLQFEIDPCFFGITLCDTEEIILPGDWLHEALPADWLERAEEAKINWDAMISEELCPWFADC